MRYLLILILLLSPIALRAEITSHAELTFAQLEQISTSPSSLDGRFSQEKYLAALDASLLSSGVFSYRRGESIRWETLEPIQNELFMTPTTIVNRQGEQELVRLEKDTNPAVTVLSEIFFSVLTAEWAKLAVYFDLSGQLDGDQWSAELIPVDHSVMHVVSRVELRGDTLLRELILHESGGDRTTIRFDSLSQ